MRPHACRMRADMLHASTCVPFHACGTHVNACGTHAHAATCLPHAWRHTCRIRAACVPHAWHACGRMCTHASTCVLHACQKMSVDHSRKPGWKCMRPHACCMRATCVHMRGTHADLCTPFERGWFKDKKHLIKGYGNSIWWS